MHSVTANCHLTEEQHVKPERHFQKDVEVTHKLDFDFFFFFSAIVGRKNNWPPLPERFPVAPCFYHDITVDIPVEFQKTVKIMYYLWMCK